MSRILMMSNFCSLYVSEVYRWPRGEESNWAKLQRPKEREDGGLRIEIGGEHNQIRKEITRGRRCASASVRACVYGVGG